MENAALCPAPVHRGQTVGRGAVRLHCAVAAGDVRTTAGADHAPLQGGTITEPEWVEEEGIAIHRPDVVDMAVDTEGDLYLHLHVDGREPYLLLHPVPETLRWTPAQGVRALQVPKELILVCARRVPLLKDPHRLPDQTRAVEAWLWMSQID